jgi:two-component system sensor histidine kinase CpxA
MRGCLGKIFLCMLLVPFLARNFGGALESMFGDPRPPSERTLTILLPPLAALTASAIRHGGEDEARAILAESGGVIRLLSPGVPCKDWRPHSLTAPLPGLKGACLVAEIPPRPPLLGFFPASWWFLFPALELLFAAVISFFLARYLAAPIMRTRAAAAQFAAGNLAARAMLTGRRRDEAADLAQEFNRMADRVSELIGAQQRFIGDVSHEIRSPLGRLALTIGLIRREADPDLIPKLDRMEQELDGVSRLVRELLTLASLQGSVAPPARELIDLQDVLAGVVDDLMFEFHDRAAFIRTVRRAGAVTIRGDGALLRRAVENVLRNALFYTPDDTTVETLVESDGHWARLVVRDHGPGVPEAALPQLFEPFFRVDQARARNTGGVGLGLAISQRAVELHGGRIRAANETPHGLTIRIDLPLAAAAA